MLVPPLCWGCRGPARRREALCAGCLRGLRRLPAEPVALGGVRAWAPLAYEGAARELVRALKYRGAVRVADAMAAQMVANAPPWLLPDVAGPPARARPAGTAPPWLLPDVAGPPARARPAASATQGVGRFDAVYEERDGPHRPRALIPVPLHHRRRRSRGFNQARLVAAALSGRMGMPVVDCLERSGDAGSQVGRGRAERGGRPHGHVRVRTDEVPVSAILVDDVVTTGGTLAACAAALREAGVGEVVAVAYARTLGR
jgi:predicted amidophosphoribosyltransferase